MTPWWLRPTAESEKTKDGSAAEGKALAETEKAPSPEETPKARSPKETPKARSSKETPKAPSSEETPKAPAKEAGKRTRKRSRAKAKDPAPEAKATDPRAPEPKPPEPKPPEPSVEPAGEAETEAGAKPPARAQRRPARRPARRPPTHDIKPDDIATVHRELSGTSIESHPETVPERNPSVNDERKIAMFCDLENIALGVRDSDIKKFDINLVLERLLEKGKIIVKRAYCDWERYSDYKRPFHEAAIEMLDIPQKYYSGKNSADIKMVVDAMDLCYAKEHLDTFVIVSGDSDFSPLVSKLKENDKYVIGIGVKNSSSNLLVDNCDEFIYYEDIWRDQQQAPQLAGLSKKASEAFSLMTDSMQALIRENKDVLWGSMIKQTMQRKRPSFNEGYYGYNSFSELLEDAEKKNIVKLKKDQRSGSYIVTGFAKK